MISEYIDSTNKKLVHFTLHVFFRVVLMHLFFIGDGGGDENLEGITIFFPVLD